MSQGLTDIRLHNPHTADPHVQADLELNWSQMGYK